ncbi:hypothetical protein BT69DRAFT_1014628 [Atractiella rhizophila]|nr:hypothetical protein BT69DRAFT_1014628 [Atractiella rhizophila]
MSLQTASMEKRKVAEGQNKNKRTRSALSCKFCRERRVRCDREMQCGSCTARGLRCEWAEGVTPTGRMINRDLQNLRNEVQHLKHALAKREAEVARYREINPTMPLITPPLYHSSEIASISPPHIMVGNNVAHLHRRQIENREREDIAQSAVFKDFFHTIFSTAPPPHHVSQALARTME